MKTVIRVGFLAGLLVSVASNLCAVTITPGDTYQIASGNQTSQADINTAIASYIGSAILLYKHAIDDGGEGPFLASYDTTYGDLALPDEDFTISNVSAPAINSNPVYVLVKDGQAQPAWYLFDISGWNGTDDISGHTFWPNDDLTDNRISHVAIYGTHNISVPDGGLTAMLLGLGMIGLATVRRFVS